MAGKADRSAELFAAFAVERRVGRERIENALAENKSYEHVSDILQQELSYTRQRVRELEQLPAGSYIWVDREHEFAAEEALNKMIKIKRGTYRKQGDQAWIYREGNYEFFDPDMAPACDGNPERCAWIECPPNGWEEAGDGRYYRQI